MQLGQTSLQTLRKGITPEQRALLDEIWNHFLSQREWPTIWEIHSPNRKAEFREALRPLGNGIVREAHDSQHGSRYELSLLGALLTSQGESMTGLLLSYLEFLRGRYQRQPKNRIAQGPEVQADLGLDEKQTSLMGRLIMLGSLFSGSASHGQNWDSGWSAGVLRAVEDFPPAGSLEKELERLVLAGYKTSEPVFLDERQSSFSSSTLPDTWLTSTELLVARDTSKAQNYPNSSNDPLKRRYQVFVSSTYEDLKEERRHVMHALLETMCIPTGMELFPAASEEQRKLIHRIIDDCDYYVVIVAGRYGSIGRSGKSYTEMEFDYAVGAGKPVIAFYHSDIESLPGAKLEKKDTGRRLLKHFTQKLKNARVCKPWITAEGLGSAIKSAILHAIVHDPKPGWVRAKDLASPAAVAHLEKIAERTKQQSSAAAVPPEKIQFQGKLSYYETDDPKERYPTWHGERTSISHTIEKNLDELFLIIGPRLHEKRNRQALKKILQHKLAAEAMNHMPTEKRYVHLPDFEVEMSVFERCLQTWLAWKLLKRVPQPKHVRLKDPYWLLTPKGIQKLAELKSL